MKGTCCCCFYNSVRSLILILSFFCIVSLFANVLLLNFAVIYNDDILPRHFLAVSTKGFVTVAPVEITGNRSRRGTNNETNFDEGIPIVDDADSTLDLITEIRKVEEPELKKKPPQDVDDGHPVVDDSFEKVVMASTYPPIIPNTRRIVLTRATFAPEVEKPEDSLDVPDSVTTILPSLATKRHVKNPIFEDKDENFSEENPIEKSPENEDSSHVDFSGVSFFDRSWDSEVMDWLFFAAPGFGMLIFHIPTSLFLKTLGSHKIILFSLVISGMSTVAVPFVIEYGQLALVITRFFQGLAFSPVFSFIGQNSASWAALKEQLWFLCTSISALIFTPIISWSLSNEIFSNIGFNVVFYIHGGISLFLGFIWLIFYRDTPQKHRWVNGLELNKIVTGKAQNNRLMERNSISMIFKSISAIAIWVSAYGYFFAFGVFCIFLPVYSNKVLYLTSYSTGSFSITPFILMVFVHWISYLMNKVTNCCGLTIKIRIFNSIGLGGCAIYFLGLTIAAALYNDENYSVFHTIVHFATLIPLGFGINGFFQSCIVVGRFYSKFIIGHLQLVFSIAFILVPATAIILTPLNLLRYWRLVFLVTAAILILSAVVFGVFGRGQPAHWAENSWDPTATHRMLRPVTMARGDECGIMEMRTVDDYLKSIED